MFLITLLDVLPEGIGNQLGQKAGEVAAGAGEQLVGLAGNWTVLGGGIILIIATVLLILFLKRVIINSILGIIAWALLIYIFNIELPFFASLIVSVIFGLAGIGAILILKFLGLLL